MAEAKEAKATAKRGPRNFKPIFVTGIRAFARDGTELEVASLEANEVTKDSAKVLQAMQEANAKGELMPYLTVDLNKVD